MSQIDCFPYLSAAQKAEAARQRLEQHEQRAQDFPARPDVPAATLPSQLQTASSEVAFRWAEQNLQTCIDQAEAAHLRKERFDALRHQVLSLLTAHRKKRRRRWLRRLVVLLIIVGAFYALLRWSEAKVADLRAGAPGGRTGPSTPAPTSSSPFHPTPASASNSSRTASNLAPPASAAHSATSATTSAPTGAVLAFAPGSVYRGTVTLGTAHYDMSLVFDPLFPNETPSATLRVSYGAFRRFAMNSGREPGGASFVELTPLSARPSAGMEQLPSELVQLPPFLTTRFTLRLELHGSSLDGGEPARFHLGFARRMSLPKEIVARDPQGRVRVNNNQRDVAATWASVGLRELLEPAAQLAYQSGNYEEARRFAEWGAHDGNNEAMVLFAQLLLERKGGGADPVAAAGWLRRAADAGSAQGAEQYAELLDQGQAVPRDSAQVAHYRELGKNGATAAR